MGLYQNRAEPLNKEGSPPHPEALMWSSRWRIRWSKKWGYIISDQSHEDIAGNHLGSAKGIYCTSKNILVIIPFTKIGYIGFQLNAKASLYLQATSLDKAHVSQLAQLRSILILVVVGACHRMAAHPTHPNQ